MRLLSCEEKFVASCLTRQKRLDGRDFIQGRTLNIIFGKEDGSCIVIQGETRVLVHVCCKVAEPKASTPNEGRIHINFVPSTIAVIDSKFYKEAQRSLERCIWNSTCVDLESLCIIAASKVWTITVNIHALNDDGNLIECASIGTVSALAHFRRPEVTVVGTDVTVHSVEEKEPVALNLHHMPISINLALFNAGKCILVDPSGLEEKVSDGCYIMGMNAHQEICYVHRRGVLLLKETEVRRIEDVAIKRAQEITQIIKIALDDDAYNRATNALIGFKNLIQTGTILGLKHQMVEISLDGQNKWGINTDDEASEEVVSADVPSNTFVVKQQISSLVSHKEIVHMNKEPIRRREWFVNTFELLSDVINLDRS